jgi:hypothetical protein
MSDIARLCLLCGIGADNHLKKTADLCKKIAKSFVKPDLGRASSVHLSTAGVDRYLIAPRGLNRYDFSAANHQPAHDANILCMDMTWVTDRIAVGGGIWNDGNMEELVRRGVTHIINMQIEFDDRPLAEPYPVKVLNNPTDDDFMPKPPALFQTGVDFALEALDHPKSKIYIHCAAGVHRAPMMTLAIMRVLGWSLQDAMNLIQELRYVVDFAECYVESVENFMKVYESANTNPR